MSIATVKTKLVSMEQAITGIKRAYAQLPRMALNEADLPAMLNFTREASYDWRVLGADGDAETRIYVIQLLVMPYEQAEQGEAEALVEPYIPLIKTYFKARPQLSQELGVMKAALISDTGPRPLAWADTFYWGVEFRLQVTEYDPRVYAALE